MNGYSKTNLFNAEDGRCWLCGAVTDTARHELFRGKNRQNSKREGLWMPLCPRCHRLAHTHEYEEELHRIGQTIFMSTGRTREDFMEIFGRNYL